MSNENSVKGLWAVVKTQNGKHCIPVKIESNKLDKVTFYGWAFGERLHEYPRSAIMITCETEKAANDYIKSICDENRFIKESVSDVNHICDTLNSEGISFEDVESNGDSVVITLDHDNCDDAIIEKTIQILKSRLGVNAMPGEYDDQVIINNKLTESNGSGAEDYSASSIESLNDYASGLGDACKDLKPGDGIIVKGYYVERSDDGQTYYVWVDLYESINEDTEPRKRISYRGYIIRPRKSDDGELYYDIIKPKWSTTEPIWDWCDSVEEAKQWIDSDKDEPFEESKSVNESNSITSEFNNLIAPIKNKYSEVDFIVNAHTKLGCEVVADNNKDRDAVEDEIIDVTDGTKFKYIQSADKMNKARGHRAYVNMIFDFDDTSLNESKSIKESGISEVEPVVKFKGKSSHTFTPDKKWEVDFDEEGNVLARTRQGKPYYFSGHINDKTNEFGHTDEDAIIQAAREQHKLKFGKLTSRKNESKSIKEGTFHWSDNKAAYEAIKVKNALKKAFNTHVFQDDSQNLYIPFNFWGRKDAEKAGVTIDTVGKFLNSIGYKYTGKSEDDEDVYNYLKDDVKIELYEVDSNRYAIHLDFDSEVDDKLDIDTTSFSSYVNTDDVDAVQDLLLDIVEGRVKTLGDIVISEEDIKNIKELCGRTLDMYTYDFAGYSDDIVDKVDDYFAMKQYQELHNKHVDESKSIKESNDSAENLSDKVKSVLDKKSQLKGLLNVTSTGETSTDIDLTVEHPWDGQWSISTMKDIIESALKELGVSYELDVIDSPNGKWTTYRYSVSSGLKESIKESDNNLDNIQIVDKACKSANIEYDDIIDDPSRGLVVLYREDKSFDETELKSIRDNIVKLSSKLTSCSFYEDTRKIEFVFDTNKINESEGRKAIRTSTVYLVDYEDGMSLPFDDRDTAIDYAIDSDAKQVVKATMYHFSDDESDTDIDGDNSEVIWTAYPNPTTENLEESLSDDEDTSMLEKMTNEGYDPLDVYSTYEIKNADTDEVIRKIHTTSIDPDDSSTWFDDDDIINQYSGDGIIITRYDYDQGMLDSSKVIYPEESEEIDESVVIETGTDESDDDLKEATDFKFEVNENFELRQSNGIIG